MTRPARALVYFAVTFGLTGCFADDTSNKADVAVTGPAVIDDIIAATGAESIEASVNPSCTSGRLGHDFESFASVGFRSKFLMDERVSAAAFATRQNGIYAAGAVRNFQFFADWHPLSEDGCLQPEELTRWFGTDAQWVDSSVSSAAIAAVFETRLFHAAAHTLPLAEKLSPREDGALPHFPRAIRDRLETEVLATPNAETLRLFGATALAQIFTAIDYLHPNQRNKEMLNHLMLAYVELAPEEVCDGTDDVIMNACSAIPSEHPSTHQTCIADADAALRGACLHDVTRYETTTFWKLAQNPKPGASHNFPAIMKELGYVGSRRAIINALRAGTLRHADAHRYRPALGTVKTNVGHHSALLFSINPSNRGRQLASEIRTLQIRQEMLSRARQDGYVIARPASNLFYIAHDSGEKTPAMYLNVPNGIEGRSLHATMRNATESVTDGMVLGALESNLVSVEGDYAFTLDQVVFNGNLVELSRLINEFQTQVGLWTPTPELDEVLHKRFGIEDVDPFFYATQTWEGELNPANVGNLEASMRALTELRGEALLEAMRFVVEHARRDSPEPWPPLREFLKNSVTLY